MTRLQQLFDEQGQSPWLDNLTRPYLHDGTLAGMVADGIRGVTANPTILAKAMEGSDAYDDQFSKLVGAGRSPTEVFWDLAIDDIRGALAILRPTFDASGSDGFVSIEVAPDLARATEETIAAARELHERIAAPNLFVKIPATAEGVPAIETMISEGRNTNITLIFSLSRYDQVIEAYLNGLERLDERGGDLSTVHSVASFFVSRVDTEVDQRLDSLGGGPTVESLRSKAALAQAKLAYHLFRERFAGPRWDRLAARGAHLQRPLWASTSTKDPRLPDTLYVDNLIGPDTVNTMPNATIAAFQDHGTVTRSIDREVDEAADVMHRLGEAGIDMEDVGLVLEEQGAASFQRSFVHVLDALDTRARELVRR